MGGLDHPDALFVATFLCFLICWFSMGYMNTDPINEDRNHRFYAEFVLFAMGMFGMVLADNFLWLFIFWEVMGLCSYLLIGFYFWKESAAYAAKKAFLTTRVGDVFLMVGLLILYDIYGSLEFSVIFEDPSSTGRSTPTSCSGRSSCSSSGRWASRRSSRCTSGCRTPWRARPRSPP